MFRFSINALLGFGSDISSCAIVEASVDFVFELFKSKLDLLKNGFVKF